MADYVVAAKDWFAVDRIVQIIEEEDKVFSTAFVATQAGQPRNQIGITFSVAGAASANLTLTNRLLASGGVVSASAS